MLRDENAVHTVNALTTKSKTGMLVVVYTAEMSTCCTTKIPVLIFAVFIARQHSNAEVLPLRRAILIEESAGICAVC